MSDKVTIITDHKWRDVQSALDVPPRVFKREFDYYESQEECEADFICYMDWWYDLSDFQFPSNPVFKGWDGMVSDTFFSGILYRYSQDGEQVMMGRFYS